MTSFREPVPRPAPPNVADPPSAPQVFSKLIGAIDTKAGKADFLRANDAAKARLFEALCDAYRDAYYAKLLYLKATNLVVARYHYAHRHQLLASRPVSLMHDPSNCCQLRCPGCVHTENPEHAKHFLWPSAVMKQTAFEKLLEEVGPFAVNTVLYNYG